jgi:hypothetical protein
VHVVYRSAVPASTSDLQKSHNPKQHFLSPFEDPPTRQPYMEGLVPIAMAVSRMTPLALSTPLSSSLELREGPHNLPLLFQGHPPVLGVVFSLKHPFSWWAEQASARTTIPYSPISIPSLLLSSFPGNTSLSLSQSKPQLASPVVLCRSLLSTSLAIPPKLSQGHGHGSRHYPAATVRPHSGSH